MSELKYEQLLEGNELISGLNVEYSINFDGYPSFNEDQIKEIIDQLIECVEETVDFRDNRLKGLSMDVDGS